jgi:predicted nucleic acid-binding protein
VTRRLRAFLDANILFSAVLGGPSFVLLLDLAAGRAIELVTSPACVVEAQTNLERKRPADAMRLADVLAHVRIDASPTAEELAWASRHIHDDDAHVLAAARSSHADVLVTGDTTHFGHLMERTDLGLEVTTLRAFLLRHP